MDRGLVTIVFVIPAVICLAGLLVIMNARFKQRDAVQARRKE